MDRGNETSADLLNILKQSDYENCHAMTTSPVSGKLIVNNLLIDCIECDISDRNVISGHVNRKVENLVYCKSILETK